MTGITFGPLRPDELLAAVADEGHGAQSLFLGVVRNNHDGRQVLAVTYEAFRPLADKILADIAKEAENQWGARVAARHRLGRLSVSEISVAVAAGAVHRAEAFAACRYAIDEIKRRLPVWKREHYADGTSSWLKGCALSGSR